MEYNGGPSLRKKKVRKEGGGKGEGRRGGRREKRDRKVPMKIPMGELGIANIEPMMPLGLIKLDQIHSVSLSSQL